MILSIEFACGQEKGLGSQVLMPFTDTEKEEQIKALQSNNEGSMLSLSVKGKWATGYMNYFMQGTVYTEYLEAPVLTKEQSFRA